MTDLLPKVEYLLEFKQRTIANHPRFHFLVTIDDTSECLVGKHKTLEGAYKN